MSDNTIQKFGVGNEIDSQLVISERLLSNMITQIKEGIGRSEKLTQDSSKLLIVISDKQDKTESLLDNMKESINIHDAHIVEIVKDRHDVLITKIGDNTEDHKNIIESTVNNHKEICDSIRQLKDMVTKFMTIGGLTITGLSLITIFLSYAVWFKGP